MNPEVKVSVSDGFTIIYYFLFQKLPNFIMGLNSMGSRIVVSDIQESFHFVKYKARENHLVIFADDVNPRYLFVCPSVLFITVI